MAIGRENEIERIKREDPETGVPYLQLTSFPTTSMLLPYIYMSVNNAFTSDSKTILFTSQRSNQRRAPFDLYRVDVDGNRLIQLTEHDGIRGMLVAATKRLVYFLDGNTLRSVNVDTFIEEEIAHFNLTSNCWTCLSADDRWYFTAGHDPVGRNVLLRIATDGSGIDTFCPEIAFKLYSVDPRRNGLFVMAEREGHLWVLLVTLEGEAVAWYGYADKFAHCCPLGKTGTFQACSRFPKKTVLTLEKDQGEPAVFVSGEPGTYFWHSAASLDGEWILADTNWPNVGLQLISVKTRRFRTLLHPRNSAGHPQYTHGHPQFSPDGRIAAFNSDQTGIGQICIATIPDEFHQKLAE